MSAAIERPLAPESKGEAPGRGRLIGRRILIVGGGQDERNDPDPPIGNGRAMAILFAREGANIAVADRNRESANATVERAIGKSAGHAALAIAADVSKPDEIKKMIEVGHEALG